MKAKSRQAVVRELQEALADRAVNEDRVLELAFELLETDTDHVRFSVDASHISRLGLELVAKQQTAVAELIKNAFDADATTVHLTFHNADVEGGTLEAVDNGNGMSRDELVSGFMRISTDQKLREGFSPKYRRPRAGRKGIGRFAAQRLGRALTVVTQGAGVDHALQLRIDWAEFSAGRDIQTIKSSVEAIPARSSTGTTLLIENLRDGWTDEQIREAYQAVAELVQPFPLTKTTKPTSVEADPGFQVELRRGGVDDAPAVADQWTAYIEFAQAEIRGSVDKRGKVVYHIKSSQYGFDERIKVKSKYRHLDDVRFQAYYYIPTEIPRQARGLISKKLRDLGGVRLYRNGFRVLPYGELYDDWLGLDYSYKRRLVLPPHANSNFLGFVELTDPAGARFEETSSREGLVENDPFRELQEFVYDGFIQLVLRVATARGRKLHARHRRSTRSLSEVAERIIEKLGAAADADTKEEIRALGLQADELARETRMIRVLASLGLTLAEFTHEVAHGFAALTADVVALRERVAADREARRLTLRLEKEVDSLRSYINYFEEAARDNVMREVKPVDLGELIEEFRHLAAPRLAKQQIDLDVVMLAYVLRTKPMHASEVTSILTNLFTNSVKAIRTAGSRGKIEIRAYQAKGNIVLECSDNGCGVKQRDRERIFDAFFTTTAGHEPFGGSSADVRGLGLGLKIARDIVESNGGRIELATPRPGFVTTFRVTLPGAPLSG